MSFFLIFTSENHPNGLYPIVLDINLPFNVLGKESITAVFNFIKSSFLPKI